LHDPELLGYKYKPLSSCAEDGKEGHVEVLCWFRTLNDGQRVNKGATGGRASTVNQEAEGWCLVL